MLFTYAHACTQAATSRHATLEGHQDDVHCVAISGDGTFIVSGDKGGTLKVWDRDKRVCMFTLTEAHGGCVTAIDIHEDGTLFVSCSVDGIIKVWGLTHGEAPKEMHKITGCAAREKSVKISPDGTKIASGSSDGTVSIWSVQTGEELQTLMDHYGSVRCVAWSPDNRLVASVGGFGDETLVWDVVGGTQATKLVRGQSKGLYGVAWGSRNSSLLVGSCGDKTINVCHLEGASATVMHTLWGLTGVVNSVSLSPDQRFVVSGSDDRTVCVREVATGKELRVLEGHTGEVNSVAWSRDGECIVSGSDDKTVRMWEADEQVCACVWLHVHVPVYMYLYIQRVRESEYCTHVGG
jgi:WD40 repeat protein